jgi:hypothetical protein
MDLYELGVYFWVGVTLIAAAFPALALLTRGECREQHG